MHIETLEVNGFKISLPVGLEIVLDTKVRDSYQEFLKSSTKDVRRHLTCLTALLPPAVSRFTTAKVLHAFGGVGASAQVLNQTSTLCEHTFWERDPVLVKHLRERYPLDVVQVDDSMPLLAEAVLSRYAVILLDMSVGTIKTKGVKEMWTNVAKAVRERSETVVWFTDTACHKMHLNYKTYTKDFGHPIEATAESYLNAYSAWLENQGMTITAAMREAGEYYCVVRSTALGIPRFTSIPYV